MRSFSSVLRRSAVSVAPVKLTVRFSSGANFEHLKFTTEGNVLRVTMNKPEMHNAFNEQLIEEITRAFQTVPANISAVVLSGEGKSFSAGADLNWMKKMVSYTMEENVRDSYTIFDMMMAIKTCPVPVVARVNGAALGGGAGLVSACDMAFALDSSVFGFTEVKLGLIPAVISPFVMDKIGRGNASRYFLTGERFKAPEAQRIGLINDKYASIEEVDKAVNGVLAEIGSSGPEAVRRAKRLIGNVARLDFREPTTRHFVSTEIASARVSAEAQARLKAFLEKSSK